MLKTSIYINSQKSIYLSYSPHILASANQILHLQTELELLNSLAKACCFLAPLNNFGQKAKTRTDGM